MVRRKLLENASLTWVPSGKFKTSLLSAQLIVPLSRESAGKNALLVNVLSRGTRRFPDLTALSRELDGLYGAQLDPVVRRMGDRQAVGFIAGFVDDRFLPGEDRLLESVAGLMGEMFCHPVLEKGGLRREYVYSERDNLADLIRSEINDKAAYAYRRMLEKMCAGEALGVPRLGRASAVERISRDALDRHYEALLPGARLEVFYCGGAPLERVEAALGEAFSGLPRGTPTPEDGLLPLKGPARKCREIVETMEVSQGNLVMGFRAESPDIPANMVLNRMFGGMPSSRLFSRVRERLSLCYSVDSSYFLRHGVLAVYAGIDPARYGETVDEILAQLTALRTGAWEEWELPSAKSTLRHSLRSAQESLGSLENFTMGQLATYGEDTLEGLLSQVEAVTEERVRAAAGALVPDTVYFLRGEGDASC